MLARYVKCFGAYSPYFVNNNSFVNSRSEKRAQKDHG
jgi:hypothetical protein